MSESYSPGNRSVKDTLNTQGDVETVIKQASSYVDTVTREGDAFRVDYYSMVDRYPDGGVDVNDEMVGDELKQAGFEVIAA